MMNKNKVIFIALVLLFHALIPSNISAADGDLDVSFNNSGFVQYTHEKFYSLLDGTSVAIQPDGKIIAGFDGQGFDRINGDAFILLRYNPDGTLDKTFDGDGRVATDVGNFEGLGQVLIQPDGKIIAIGTRYSGTTAQDFAILRYLPNGTLDNTFDGNGLAVANFVGTSNDLGFDAVLQPDGKIIVVGRTDRNTDNADFDIALARYNANGSLDTGFGGGIIAVSFNNNTSERATCVALQPDGKILVAGTTGSGVNADIYVLRFNADGSQDSTFNGGSILFSLSSAGESANSISVQADGKILIGGSANTGALSEFAVVRLLSNGSFDSSFGSGGKTFTSFGATEGGFLSALVVQNNGKIVAVGSTSTEKFAIARYHSSGALDLSFSVDGKTTTFNSNRRATGAALQANGKLVVAGEYRHSSGMYFDAIIARYELSETTHRKTRFDFDGDGKSDISVFRPENGSWYLNRSIAGFTGQQFGLSTDKLAPADYDGDGKTDIAVFRDGNWYISNSSNNAFRAVQFGSPGDVPVPADYDGDDKADIAVFRNGFWYFLSSMNNQFRGVQFGIATDKPVPADFDGDNKSDIAVFREGFWYWLESSTNQFRAIQFGITGDKPIVSDYDGDSKADQAVFRNGVWYLNRSTEGFTGMQFGLSTDTPTPEDYDGDGKADISVFREGNWYRLNSTNSQFYAVQFGVVEDKPVPAAFIP